MELFVYIAFFTFGLGVVFCNQGSDNSSLNDVNHAEALTIVKAILASDNTSLNDANITTALKNVTAILASEVNDINIQGTSTNNYRKASSYIKLWYKELIDMDNIDNMTSEDMQMKIKEFMERRQAFDIKRNITEFLDNSTDNVTSLIQQQLRHGPFDIQGGGGLGFWSGPRYSVRTKSEQDYFFRRPFGPDYYFFYITKSLNYIIYAFATTLHVCLIQAFATTLCFSDNLILKFKAFDLYSHSIQVFATTTD